MKIKNAFFASLFAIALLTGATMFALNAGAQSMGTGMSPAAKRGAAIVLQCRNYGGQQDVSKNPDIISRQKWLRPSSLPVNTAPGLGCSRSQHFGKLERPPQGGRFCFPDCSPTDKSNTSL